MKLTFFMMVVCLMEVSASVYSQATKFSFNVQGKQVVDVLKEIESQSAFRFFYQREQIDVTQKVDLKVTEGTVEKVLEELFRGQDVTCQVLKDNLIVITPRGEDFNSSEMAQQQRTISGRVTDSSGVPLPGVTVVIKGTTIGTITDTEGKYNLANVLGKATLQFSFVGMTSQEIIVGNKAEINTTMLEEVVGIEEVVAVGYGIQKKVNLTGAVGQVNSETLEGKAVTNVQELLQGKTPGLNVTKSSGQPGSGASFNIRGTSTIGGSSGVLVIVDGVPGNIYTVNPNDIESISILKDAASASIYGSRAANGVILITTKKGNDKKELSVSVNTSQGITNPLHFIDFLGGEDFMNLYNLARRNEGNSDFYTEQDFQNFKNGKITEAIWYKEIFKENQLLSNNHISLSGKTEKLQYNISGSYDYQSGAVPKNNYNRYIFKPDFTFEASKWLSLRANIQYTETYLKEPQGGISGNLANATRISPITPITNSLGQYAAGGTPGGNPIAIVNNGGQNKDRYKETLSIFTAMIQPLKNWNIIPMLSIRSTDQLKEGYTKPITLYTPDGEIYSQEALSTQTIAEYSYTDVNKVFQVTSDYSVSLNDIHNIRLLAGFSREYNKHEEFWASRKNMAFNEIYVLDIGIGTKDNGGTKYHDAIQSVFGRVNYDYKEKYLFEANIRLDGTSRFSEGHRWGTFPSFSGGWNVHHEEFFSKAFPYISKLKIRGSWGILGDALKISRYETRNLLSFNSKAYAYNGSTVSGAWSSSSFDSNISWEKAKMTNVGAEFGIWDNRLEIVFDYFNNVREDILYQAPVPSEYGLSAPYINALEMRNRGIESMISFKNSYRELKYNFDVNFNYSKNEVLNLHNTGPWKGTNTFTDVGTQLEMPYGYEAIGLFQSEEEVSSSADQVNVKPGNIKYRDQNKDKIIDGKDRVILNDRVPLRFGINMSLEYDRFDFSANLYGLLNNYRYISGYEGWAFYLTTNARPMHLDSWTTDNKNASYPRLTTNMTGNDREYSSFWLRKANYLKIQSIQIGYTLSPQISKKAGFDNARIYLSGQNLGIISNYVGFDPEGGYYPLARTFAVGVQLKF